MLVILCVFPKDEVGSFSGSFITFKINFKIFSNYNFSYLFCFIALVLFQNFLLYIYWISLPIFSSYHFLSNLFLFLTFLSFAFSILHYVLIFYFFIIFIYSCVLVQFHFWSDFFFLPFISVVFWMLSSLWLVIVVQAFWVILHVIMWIQKPQCHCHHILRILKLWLFFRITGIQDFYITCLYLSGKISD